jgi:hypothetical protein
MSVKITVLRTERFHGLGELQCRQAAALGPAIDADLTIAGIDAYGNIDRVASEDFLDQRTVLDGGSAKDGPGNAVFQQSFEVFQGTDPAAVWTIRPVSRLMARIRSTWAGTPLFGGIEVDDMDPGSSASRKDRAMATGSS